jgi:threonine/homoserine/homoserine lactone efflux protein
MGSTQSFLAFLATAAMFAFIPGPAMLFAAAQTLARGRRSGLMAALGLHLGGYAHVGAAAAGLSVLFHAVPWLYLGVKLAGAVYLIWLGLGLFRAPPPAEVARVAPAPRSGRRAFLESITVEILNPKTALFFLALLPQFVDAGAAVPVVLQFLVLGTIVNLMFSTVDVVCVLMAGAIMARLRRSSRAQRLLRRAGGSILIGLGTHLAFQRS